jgi:DNA invertase Pin-like site-specific DNA recombinase
MTVVHDTELAEIIVDAEGAKNLDRPGMKRILDLVRGGGVDTVIVAKLDRLTRSTSKVFCR